MNILVPDEWLREFLKTKATPKQIADYLSLCGPSVEKIEKTPHGPVYAMEITTNRVDAASIYGIAREAAAILPRFGVQAKLQSVKVPSLILSKNVSYLQAKVDTKLCPRFTAVLIRGVKRSDSPKWMQERLLSVGVRPINNVVDISNYIMHEIGQPVHTFDYDKIQGAKMTLRESRPEEKLTTLDGKTHELPGRDIIIEDGKGRLIDLAGIMGAENSAVDANTKNVLLFVQTYNPLNIRRTSMSLAHRTEAAVLFEKGLDPELVTVGISRGIELFKEITGGLAEKEILDIYPNPYKAQVVKVDYQFLVNRLGIDISKSEISKLLLSLEFESVWQGNSLKVSVPSFRGNDISIPEDIVEEVARVFGYQNFPSRLMTGLIPDPLPNTPFDFEQKIKNVLCGWGGCEIYTLSLVQNEWVNDKALGLINPLGADTEYLRTSLMPSLVSAANENRGVENSFHFFEIANVYLPRTGELPEEKMMLAGIFANTGYREAKGSIEALFESLNIDGEFSTEDSKGFLPSRRLEVCSGQKYLGQFGVLEKENYIYYEFEMQTLQREAKAFGSYKPIPKYPAQIEDVTLTFPERTKIGEVIKLVSGISKLVARIELVDTYEDSYTFRIWYQDPRKTLTDDEVKREREIILKNLNQRFAASLKAS